LRNRRPSMDVETDMKLTAILALATLVAACGVEMDAMADPPTTTSTPDPSQVSARASLAIGDLARHLGIPRERIEVVSDEDVTWSDGSIGCPEPGMNYTQATVPGYLVVLAVDDTTHRYHGAHGQDPFRCDRIAEPPTFDPGY
jgi:hypothetical protein